MRTLSSFIFVASLLMTSLSNAGALDGSTFCRSVTNLPTFGQPSGKSQHCISFNNNSAFDNGDTFFGNPPKTYRYKLVGNKLFNASKNVFTGYYLIGNQLIDDAKVLTRV